MKQSDINALVGKEIIIRSVRHVCISAGKEALMLLELNAEGKPVQYIVAHHPSFHNGELIWTNGNYFLGFQLPGLDSSTGSSLRDAALCLDNTILYVAMVSDDYGVRSIGVFIDQNRAATALEELINRDDEVCQYKAEYGVKQFSLKDFKELYVERSLENDYWIEEHSVNKADDKEEN